MAKEAQYQLQLVRCFTNKRLKSWIAKGAEELEHHGSWIGITATPFEYTKYINDGEKEQWITVKEKISWGRLHPESILTGTGGELHEIIGKIYGQSQENYEKRVNEGEIAENSSIYDIVMAINPIVEI